MCKPTHLAKNLQRVFDHFPAHATCPVCGVSEDHPCVLVSIDGTANDGIVEALPVHLVCAAATNVATMDGRQILYREVRFVDVSKGD
jgi:hypothetical protein